MDNICKICNLPVSEKAHFYREHKIKEKDYFEKYFPRTDLFNGGKIEFKSQDSYFLTDFNDKRNLKAYLQSLTKDKGLEYLKLYLERRKQAGKTNYALSEFEIKSLIFPSLVYFEKVYELSNYQNICNESGLQIKSNYNTPMFNRNLGDTTIFCDTREQNPLLIPNLQVTTLNFGDYSNPNSNIYIERKSLNDFLGTMSKGYDRFKKEIERCKAANAYLIVLIEEKYSTVQSFEYLSYIRAKSTWNFISHQFRTLCQDYPFNLQFLAVDGRKEAIRVIQKIFKLEDNIVATDLQFLYDKGVL